MKQTRRDFIVKASLAGSAVLMSPSISAKNFFKGSPARKVVIGVMGTNSRGMFLAKNFAALPDTEVAYICDVDEQVLAKTIASVEQLTGKKPKGFSDVRKLLERKDLDALVIAAPDHWHAPAAILACQAGKHVYLEKPCSHNPHEGEMLINAASRYNRLVQMGSQRRSFSNVQKAVQQLHEGVIGRVYYARGWYTNWRKTIGFGKEINPPPYLNFDLWQGPAPRRAYRDNLVHYNWHWFWHWGTGEALNNGTHEIDVMRWGLGVEYPVKVSSAGGRFAFKDDWETPDTQTITFNFPNNSAISWEGRSCNGYDGEGTGRGVIFYGESGTLVYPGANSYKIFDNQDKLVSEVKDETPFDATNTVSPMEKLDAIHLSNFVESIRENEKLSAPILEGHRSTLLPQLGNIAYRLGRPLNCDPTNGTILQDKEALSLWSREYEKGWELKV